MKVQIRNSLFETNSSSTHSLCIYDGSDWNRFKSGEMVIEYGPYDPKLVEVTDEIKDRIFDPDKDRHVYDYDYLTYDVWKNIWNYYDYAWETLEEEVADKHVVSFYRGE